MPEPERKQTEDLETLLQRARDGDEKAREQLYSVIYPELRRLARHFLRQERVGHTLQPTALVNEVFVKLSAGKRIEWENRAQLVAVVARQMRWILVDHARRRDAQKRGDTLIPLSLAVEPARREPRYENILAINEALDALEQVAERTVRVVELKVIGGMSEPEIAEVLGIGISTVKRDWLFAKAWLSDRLR